MKILIMIAFLLSSMAAGSLFSGRPVNPVMGFSGITDGLSKDSVPLVEPGQYHVYWNVPATELTPGFKFDLTGVMENGTDFYYPVRLEISWEGGGWQEYDFAREDFAPCTRDDFGWEYGDFRFDGYGGFRMLSTSMGMNPSYYYWIWDSEKMGFVENPDLGSLVGDTVFDYDKKAIRVTSRGGADLHLRETYEYLDGQLTLTEKVEDKEGERRVYRLVDQEWEEQYE